MKFLILKRNKDRHSEMDRDKPRPCYFGEIREEGNKNVLRLCFCHWIIEVN